MTSCEVQEFRSLRVQGFKSLGVEKSKLSNSQTPQLYNYLHLLIRLSVHLFIYLLLVTGYLLLVTSFAYAGTFGKSSGEAGFSFLKIPLSARASGMGEAFTGVPNDAQGFEYNPASPGTLKVREIWLSHLSYFENINMEGIHFAYPHKQGTFSLHSRFLYTKDTYRDRAGVESGDFTNENIIVNVGHSFKITPSFFVGCGVKYLSEKLESSYAKTAAADVGAFYQFQKLPVAVGLSLQNIGNDAKHESAKDPLPLTLRFGGSYRIGQRTLCSIEGMQSLDQDLHLKAGLEYYINAFLVIRTGFKLERKKMEDFNGVTAGLGFVQTPIFLDYAFVPSSDLGFTHRVSLGIKWHEISLGKKRNVEEILRRIEEIKREKKPEAIEEEVSVEPTEVAPETRVDEFHKASEFPDLHFEFGTTDLDEPSIRLLVGHADYLKKNSNLEILIEGHCDDRGTSEYNFSLGMDRAQVIRDLYQSLGIESSRISIVSFGKDKLICFVPTDECRAQNRRIEVKVRRKRR